MPILFAFANIDNAMVNIFAHTAFDFNGSFSQATFPELKFFGLKCINTFELLLTIFP